MAKKKEETELEKRIRLETNRIKKIFKNIEKDKMDICIKLIQNASFMAIQMEDMQNNINESGVTIKYQNGENQWGYKKSPDVETYNSFIKQYTTIIKQLTELLPKDVGDKELEEIKEMLKKPT